MIEKQVRVRVAPSPTGYYHLGSARTALFNWLYARHTGGKFILRIEDTDRTRFVPDSLQDIMDSMHWLELPWDEGPDIGGPHAPYLQSERLPLYHEWTEWLVAHEHAYRCYCTRERLEALRLEQQANRQPIGYDRHCRYLSLHQRAELEASGAPSVIRFAMPTDGVTGYDDISRDTRTVDNSTILDPVLMKSDGFPTYHLANVVDDHFMEITHIVRGDEWLSSVPLHVNLYRAFDWEMPVYAHAPLILDPSGKGKLSKRKKKSEDGSEVLTYIREYRGAGYLPDAMVNWLALLGWSYSADTDLFTRDEAISRFDIHDINPSPAALPLAKLEWMNGHYMRQLSTDQFVEQVSPFIARALGWDAAEVQDHPATRALAPHIKERLKRLDEAGPLVDFAYVPEITYAPGDLLPKGLDAEGTRRALAAAIELLETVPFEEAEMEAAFRGLAQQLNVKAGQLFSILRVAITGKAVAPPLFGSLIAVGRECALERCRTALERVPG